MLHAPNAENPKPTVECIAIVAPRFSGFAAIVMATLAAVFAWVAVGANVALANYGPVIASAYRLRTWLFGLAVVVLVAVNYDTLGKLPYVSSMSASSSATATQRVEAVAEQWSWNIKPDAFRVGQTVEFHVTSTDVNHGFALYNPDMRKPRDINVGQVVRDTEDRLDVIGCLDHTGFCRIEPVCVLRGVLRDATVAFLAVLDAHTLADLIKPHKALSSLLVGARVPTRAV